MEKTITFTALQYKCLRGHLEAIDKIIGGKDLTGGLTSEGKPSRQNRKEPNCKRLMTIKN